ncbi:MAG: serine/threonine protein kinase [Nannocystales bacterium]
MSFGGVDAWHQPGAQVGRYRLIDRLAVGGMAELFLGFTAAMHGFEKLVVLKRILPQFAENPDFVRMFLDEARLAATLDHPNIAHVTDIGEHDGSYFFSMEYVHGQSLLRVMRAVTKARRPLPLEHSLNVIIGTCAGLHYAHEKVGLDGTPLGIVHRDVSPPNLILTYDGTVKVVDFGIAKAATAKSNTAVGTLKGKIPYMAPEQCRSEPLDRRSDIFSIGIILYELTVGRRLFQAETEIAIIQKITSGGFPPPTSVHPSYPGELEAIVMRALQLNPDARYSTARDLQIDLEEFAREYKLAISSARLGSFMEELFDEEQRRMPVSTNLPPPEPVPQPAAPPPPPAASPSPAAPTPAPPPTPAPAARQSSPDFEAFASALSKVLDDGGTDPLTEEIGNPAEPPKVHGIDLDNLQLEELDPSKYDK